MTQVLFGCLCFWDKQAFKYSRPSTHSAQLFFFQLCGSSRSVTWMPYQADSVRTRLCAIRFHEKPADKVRVIFHRSHRLRRTYLCFLCKAAVHGKPFTNYLSPDQFNVIKSTNFINSSVHIQTISIFKTGDDSCFLCLLHHGQVTNFYKPGHFTGYEMVMVKSSRIFVSG